MAGGQGKVVSRSIDGYNKFPQTIPSYFFLFLGLMWEKTQKKKDQRETIESSDHDFNDQFYAFVHSRVFSCKIKTNKETNMGE